VRRFKTFTPKSFSVIWDLFYDVSGSMVKKSIKPGIITNYLDEVGLAYWVMVAFIE